MWVGLLAAAVAVVLRERRNPTACPYSQRWMLEFPRPWLTTSRLLEILEPKPGERLLEIGPGTGVQTLPVARALEPGGSMDVLDVQREMLDALMRRASDEGVSNIRPEQRDARRLPYDDATFDAAFLVAVLGEVPDQQAALSELARVVKPGGRVVVGELFGDPHWVSPKRLRRQTEAAGLSFDHQTDSWLGYFACFTRPALGTAGLPGHPWAGLPGPHPTT